MMELDIRKVVEYGRIIKHPPQKRIDERIDRLCHRLDAILVTAVWYRSVYAHARDVQSWADCRKLLHAIRPCDLKRFIVYAVPKKEIENCKGEEWVRDFPIPEKPKKTKPGRLLKKSERPGALETRIISHVQKLGL